MLTKTTVSLVLVAWLCATRLGFAGNDVTVEIPTAANAQAATVQVDSPLTKQKNVTVAGVSALEKNVVEQEKERCWNWAVDLGYTSEYNFRGTDLMPGSDGGGFFNAEVSKWNFTLGIYGIHQIGRARANSFAMGEGGGGGTSVSGFLIVPNPFFPIGPPVFSASGTVTPETIQDRFNEVDVFLRYNLTLGPVDITVGNIGFFIDRRARTSVAFTNLFVNAPGVFVGPIPFDVTVTGLGTVENEVFDRVFIRLATSKIPHIQPSVTYYQTVINSGQDEFHFSTRAELIKLGVPPMLLTGLPLPTFRGGERNNDLGGYLEGRIRGTFPITNRIDFNPYGIISYSFSDRSEPVANPTTISELLRGRSLDGFNHAQVGMELPINLLHMTGSSSGPCAPPDVNVYFVPFAAYSYHISDPTPGTDRDEVWGGAKFTVTF